jgi:plastocyanin
VCRPRVARRRRVVLALAVALLLAGCTPDRSGVEATAGERAASDGMVVEVVATDDLRWEPPQLQLPSGGVEIALVCEPAVNHNLVIVETGQEVAVCAPGQTERAVLDLEAGDYTYLCTVPGHSATMRGELTVTSQVLDGGG